MVGRRSQPRCVVEARVNSGGLTHRRQPSKPPRVRACPSMSRDQMGRPPSARKRFNHRLTFGSSVAAFRAAKLDVECQVWVVPGRPPPVASQVGNARASGQAAIRKNTLQAGMSHAYRNHGVALGANRSVALRARSGIFLQTFAFDERVQPRSPNVDAHLTLCTH